jgi:hypothetical protein
MSRISYQLVEFIPRVLAPGVLYISERYRTASHMCPCGCGEKVVTPLSPADWQLTFDNGLVSLRPSIGNWNYPCQSHYWIRRNEIVWSGSMSAARIARVQHRDRLDKSRLVEQRNRAKQSLASTPSAEPATRDHELPSLWMWLKAAVARLLRIR